MLLKNRYLRFLPLALILLFMILFYFSDLPHMLTFENLKKEHLALKAYVAAHPFLSPLLFIAVYIASVCLIIPDSTLLTLISGAVFPLPLAIFYTTLSETIGAYIFFISLEWAIGTKFLRKDHSRLARMQNNFRTNATNYLLFLRLSHIVPFWLINVAAAYFRVKPATFLWTTFVGVLPLNYLIAEAGSRLSMILANNIPITFAEIFNTELKLVLLLFGLCALIPLLYKKFSKRK